jgi:acetaldehyde dehydrogenase (acetylating)
MINKKTEKLKIAILGSGNIGTDLLIKLLRSPYLDCTLFAGRNLSSPGLVKANSLGVKISDQGIDAILHDSGHWDLMFDATSAVDHIRHWSLIEKLGKMVIDMTPARVGKMCIPAINLKDCIKHHNINMITCGGQASIPIAYAISQVHPEIEYIEVVSSISSRSAGPATRLNIDEYIETTEKAIKEFTNAKRTKTILILNPAQPCVNMQTTIFARVAQPDLEKIQFKVMETVKQIQKYVPGYQLLVPPILENNRIAVMIKVQGLGDYLPVYSGNLDIINCAAIAVAEEYAKEQSLNDAKALLLVRENAKNKNQ